MWDFHYPTPPLEQSMSPLNRGSTPFSFGVLVIFYYAFEEAPLLFFWSFFVRHLMIYQFIGMAKFRAWLWYMLDEDDSPQWYDIVHFEHKLSWLCFGLPWHASFQWYRGEKNKKKSRHVWSYFFGEEFVLRKTKFWWRVYSR